jgi:tetratricopeptide (TPR) repeat protein
MTKGGRSKRFLKLLWNAVVGTAKPIASGQVEPIDIKTLEPIDWDADVVVGQTETYDALVRSISRTAGFGMFFVRCVEGDQADVVARLRSDLPKLKLERMVLESEVEDGNLYRRVKEMVDRDTVDILCISGLEKSLDPYVKSGYGGVGDYYNKDMVPRVLGHLNLQRERFRDDFPFCFIFFLSAFGIKFIARRSPDFFDWRSGIFEFVPDAEVVEKLTREIYGNYTKYLTWTHEQRLDRIREIQALIDEDQQSRDGRVSLFFERGNILAADESREEAIVSYDKAIEFKPDKHEAWNNRGNSLAALGRREEAIGSFDKAIEFKPDKHEAWYNRGVSLDALGRREEAIASYEKAIEFKPDKHAAWNNRGISLAALGRREEAIGSFDKAIEFKPDKHEAWNNRGRSLDALGRREEAIASYDKAIEFKPDLHEAFYNRACCHSLMGNLELALEDLTIAFRLAPEEYRQLATTDSDLDPLRELTGFIRLLETTET